MNERSLFYTRLSLERDVVVGDFGGCADVVGGGGGALVVGCAARAVVAAAFAFSAAGEQRDVVDDDFRAVFLFAGGLVVPGAGLNLALDVELGALLHIVADDLGSALEGDEVVPFGAVGPVAGRVFGAVGGGKAEAGNHGPAGRCANFRVFAYVAEKDDFIDALCHGCGAPVSVLRRITGTLRRAIRA